LGLRNLEVKHQHEMSLAESGDVCKKRVENY